MYSDLPLWGICFYPEEGRDRLRVLHEHHLLIYCYHPVFYQLVYADHGGDLGFVRRWHFILYI